MIEILYKFQPLSFIPQWNPDTTATTAVKARITVAASIRLARNGSSSVIPLRSSDGSPVFLGVLLLPFRCFLGPISRIDPESMLLDAPTVVQENTINSGMLG